MTKRDRITERGWPRWGIRRAWGGWFVIDRWDTSKITWFDTGAEAIAAFAAGGKK